MIAYVIMQPGTDDVLLEDGSWGHQDTYWEKAEVCTCLVRANRRAARYRYLQATACPWPLPENTAEASSDEAMPESPIQLEFSDKQTVYVPMLSGLSWPD